MSNEPIPLMGFPASSDSIDTLRRTLADAWNELISDEAELHEIAEALKVPAEALRSSTTPPFTLKQTKAGMLPTDIALILSFIASSIIIPALIELSKEELKNNLKKVIKNYLIPKWKRMLKSADSLGKPKDID